MNTGHRFALAAGFVLLAAVLSVVTAPLLLTAATTVAYSYYCYSQRDRGPESTIDSEL